MNEQPIDDSLRFRDFLVEHYAPARDWVDPLGYCRWNMVHGFMAAVVGDDGNICALGCARPVDRPGFGVLPYYFNEHGSSLHIDVLVDKSNDERAIMALRNITLNRFGPRETVAMFRHEKESAIKVYEYQKFWNHILRLKKVKMKKEKKDVSKPTTCSA